VFYITSGIGPKTMELVLANMKAAGLPFAEGPRDITDSDKEPRQRQLAQSRDVVFLGDNLNDFRRRYYVTGGKPALEVEDGQRGCRRFILFPNPTDGH
jgi:predicted secreted acid phosphatase